MIEGYIVNGIRSMEPLDVGMLDCFKTLLKCGYGDCKKRLHGVLTDLLLDDELVTYELVAKNGDRSSAIICVKDDESLTRIREALSGIIEKDFSPLEKRPPSYNAIEAFFDLLVGTALRKAGFKRVKGLKGYLDGDDVSRYLKTRTIIEVRRNGAGNEEYHGILFVDYGIISRSLLADKLLERLDLEDFSALGSSDELRRKAVEVAGSFIEESVLTLVKRGSKYEYVYGKVAGLNPLFSRDMKLNNGSLYDLWASRYAEDDVVRRFAETEPSGWEYPLFQVRIEGYSRELTYPPSMLRLVERLDRPDPSTRWDEIMRAVKIIEKRIKEVYSRLTGASIQFRYIKRPIYSRDVDLMPNFYTGTYDEKPFKNSTVKLRYRDAHGREKASIASPLYMFSNGNRPYAGSQSLDLIVVYPSTVSRQDTLVFTQHLSRIFMELNFGSIGKPYHYPYNYVPENLSESLASLEKTLENVLSKHDPGQSLPLIIVPDNEQFYKHAKTHASRMGFHSQLVRKETLETVLKYDSEISNPRTQPQAKKRMREALRALLSNISGGIYVEYLIQKSTSQAREPGPLTWILDTPADRVGKSMYVGLDVSTKRGVAGAAFILLDPQGRLLNARLIQLRTETLNFQDWYELLLYMVTKAREKGLNRIVVLRDGIPKTPLELQDCTEAHEKVTRELGHEIKLDYVSVIKNNNTRIFAIKDKEKTNPIQGTYMYLYKTRHLGYNAHEILVASTKPEETGEDSGGTTRPVILRVYETTNPHTPEQVKQIAKEYLALTRLNYWNLRTGASRLALPVKMADTISYMTSMGIPIKTP